MTNNKKHPRAVGKNIIIYSKGKKESRSIMRIETGSYDQHKIWKTNDCEVVSVGEDVTVCKSGDKVMLDPLAKLRKIDPLTEHMEKVLGRPMKRQEDLLESAMQKTKLKKGIDLITPKQTKVETPRVECYFFVKNDDILGVM